MSESERKCLECGKILTFENGGSKALCKSCMLTRVNHPQKESICGDLVDEKLVDIIDIFYKNDITTTNSCQASRYVAGNPTWIQFGSITDVELLLSLIKNKCDSDFYNYIKDSDLWKIDFNVDDDDDEQCIINVDTYYYSLAFPSSDLEYFRENIHKLTIN